MGNPLWIEKIMKARKRTAAQRLLAPHYCDINGFKRGAKSFEPNTNKPISVVEKKFEEKKKKIALSIETHPEFKQKLKKIFAEITQADFDMYELYPLHRHNPISGIKDLIELCKRFDIARIRQGKVEVMEPFSFYGVDFFGIKLYRALDDAELRVISKIIKQKLFLRFDRVPNRGGQKRYDFVSLASEKDAYFSISYHGNENPICIEIRALLDDDELRCLIRDIKSKQKDCSLPRWKPFLNGKQLEIEIENRFREIEIEYKSSGRFASEARQTVMAKIHKQLAGEFKISVPRVKKFLS